MYGARKRPPGADRRGGFLHSKTPNPSSEGGWIYGDIQKEETLKAQVFADFFDKAKFSYEPNINNIDFIVTDAKLQKDGICKHYFLWAEVKKGVQDVPTMLTQLVLTIKKTYDKGDRLPPPYIGCFDTQKIAFVPFYDILPIFAESDFNWNVTPSNHGSPDFQKARQKVSVLVLKNLEVYNFDKDRAEIIHFINNNLTDGTFSEKNIITKNNFVHIYNKWVKEVKPSINMPKDKWLELKTQGILDCDFYRADIMNSKGNTITEKLKIILEKDCCQFHENIKGWLFSGAIDFADGGAAHHRFWDRYERPPEQEYWQYIIDRRDLLVPQNIREVKGSFFTPAIWVEKSQEYLEAAFGKNWQDEYVIWDCAAGTGNLLAGLVNKDNLWASTLDQPDVDTMHALIDDGFNLWHEQVFQFDFLNDSFDKLPNGLREIVEDPERRRKLIVYINPPYAEGDSKIGKGRKGVHESKIHRAYKLELGKASGELYAQFLMRIYREMPGVKLAQFSKLKHLQAPNFENFRMMFWAKLRKLFLVPAFTFDNVNGQFPVGCFIWDTAEKEKFTGAEADVFGIGGEFLVRKKIVCYDGSKYISDWLEEYSKNIGEYFIGHLGSVGNDFQNQNYVFIDDVARKKKAGGRHTMITSENLMVAVIYFAVRHAIIADWLNDRDQFLYPDEDWKTDEAFKYDCLVFTLFNNNIQSRYGVNHWIPFTEEEVNAKAKFQSNFMNGYIKGKPFSPEAQAVLDSGRELWRYYHAKIASNRTASTDASFYDIREFFQGRSEKGTMRQKSEDERYNELVRSLRGNLALLAEKIRPKIYGYGFLAE